MTIGPVKIAVQQLAAFFGETQVLRQINLQIAERKVLAIIGPSGCGKSTLIRCMNRIHETVLGAHYLGNILLDGKNILHLNEVHLRRRVGMIFQRPNPFPMMSIFDNVASGLKLGGFCSKAQLAETVERCLQQAALWDEVKEKLHQSGASLSGGQQQRLCIARALAVEPEVLLMDEPCSALDPISTARVEELIDELRKRYTIVIVTHNMQQAARVSDFTAFLYMGELIEHSETRVLFTNPQQKKTEDYITGRFG